MGPHGPILDKSAPEIVAAFCCCSQLRRQMNQMTSPMRGARPLLLLFLGLSWVCPFARSGRALNGHARSMILWVQEVHGRPLYWVNDRPYGRAQLSELEKASGSERNIALTVILDSRVPIQEMAEIEGLMEKMDLKDVRYYVFKRAYPKVGMSE